ncbi:PREDICTED: prosaposin [Prunus mume]|uniref:Prosaposin n=1 Tax=Prunus mume TaxID=102107 RepID=A0ABM1LZK8_PRUMU|nr:PREDICTED: prosaposin [Prunus mume]XP_008245133.1 PREDICTED: prosaposin [Prunus mume]XP_016652835.1 PREDICTED: prosaposin [Prunus mume]
MDVRVGVLVLFVLGASWAGDARHLANLNLPVTKTAHHIQEVETQTLQVSGDEFVGNDNVCTLCEEFAAQALDYLDENKTQTEIIEALHQTCSQLRSFKQQCITLVDYYAPLFFLEVYSLQPSEFCRKVNLCQQVALFSSQLREDSCGLCHRAVSEVLVKLKDPDTQLEIIELLLKACNSVENYAKKCKRIVFEYGPLFLANAEQFLETTDICTTLHACNSSVASTEEASPVTVVTVLSDS